MSFGFLMAPVQFKWFQFLTRVFPMAKGVTTVPALKRVAFDQLIMAPIGTYRNLSASIAAYSEATPLLTPFTIGLGLFFSFMTIAEGGGKRAVAKKFQDVYIPSLKANYLLWPAVQIVNFSFMPLQFQLPFVSTIGIAWTAYLSLSNASDD